MVATYNRLNDEGSSLMVQGVKFQILQGRKTKAIKAISRSESGENVLKQVTFLSLSTGAFQASCLGGFYK